MTLKDKQILGFLNTVAAELRKTCATKEYVIFHKKNK